MKSRNLITVLVCMVFIASVIATNAYALTFKHATFAQQQEDLYAPKSPVPQQFAKAGPLAMPQARSIYKVRPRRIAKVRPAYGRFNPATAYQVKRRCILPIIRPKGWEMNAEAFFARMKGKVRYARGNTSAYYRNSYDVDLNDDLGVPEHGVIPEFTATYRFRRNWALRYSIMPMMVENTSSPNRSFVFGSNNFTNIQNGKVKWERLLQHLGIVYDAVKTHKSRVSIFTDFVRINDKLSYINLGCCGDTWDEDMNMAMVGLEFEKCLRTGRRRNTLSLVCKAGVAFLDEAVGADVMTGLKYSIPMNKGRWGYVKGGYRFATYKKGYSEVKLLDTAMEGASIQMGFIF